MLKNNFLSLFFLLFGSLLTAQVTVSGHVTFADFDGNAPVPMWEVFFSMGDGTPEIQTLTNEEGYYEIDIENTSPAQLAWVVGTFDLCSGEYLRKEIQIDPNTSAYIVDLVICAGVDPPDPVDACEAFFYSEQVAQSEDGYIVDFFDISYHSGEVISWEWTFGDGTGSTEQNPTHVYTVAGDYLVSLTIGGAFDNGVLCTSTIEYDIVVWNESDCDCPTDNYDPVCVFTPSGQLFEFTSPCYAECAGFEDYVTCEEDCICPQFYAPVCVTLEDGTLVTFDNHCYAECEGFGPDQWEECEPNECDCPTDTYNPVCIVIAPGGPSIVFDNACLAECAGFEPGDYQDCDSDCICPDFYEPVCVATEDGTIVEFLNFCEAECAGYDSSQWIDCDNNCDCFDALYDPVCVATPGGLVITFENPCLAECAGYTEDVYYACDPFGCDCPDIYDPVCVISLAGIITFPNACLAECAGFTEDAYVDCQEECECTDDFAPVCVSLPGDPSGNVVHFPNACLAECAGFTEADFVNCQEDCICPQVYAPVCVSTDAGMIITFDNSCYAECAGYGPDEYFDCNAGGCECPDVWAPVCVATPTGEIITYSNICEAECAGYTDENLVDCEDGACNCEPVWDPVCVSGIEGVIVTFPNECVALCEGFTPEDFVECADCECDDYYLPVCVITETGEFIEFSNPCYAACAGYGQDAIAPCFPTDDCWADFTFDVLDNGLDVQFTDLSYAEDDIISWAWDFGDGTTSTEQNPTHIYAEDGVYDIILVVTSEACGEFETAYHICIGDGGGVGGPDCQGFFFFEQADPADLLAFQFVDLSLGAVNAWAWDFGDGTTSTEQNPVHLYEEAGEYMVTLSIFAGDCQSTVSIPVTVGDDVWYGDLNCRAWFLPITSPDNLDVFFINLSSPDAIEFSWDFGDGQVSNDPLALHNYAEAGTYTVTLTTITEDGCENSFSAIITIGTEGDDGFGASPTFSLITGTDEVAQLKGLQAAPNPTSGHLRISWNVEQAGDYNWQVFDINGRLVEQLKARSATGIMTTTIDLSNQPSGIYLFRLQTADGIQTLRVSKI